MIIECGLPILYVHDTSFQMNQNIAYNETNS